MLVPPVIISAAFALNPNISAAIKPTFKLGIKSYKERGRKWDF